jgi:glycerol-3-phosphate acyltransferase PlsY
MNYFISSLIGYLLGSIPSGYLLLKKYRGIDIRNEGSGNVGAYNSYDVTKSKQIGISVLLIDLIKGILSVLVVKIFYPDSFVFSALSLFFAVFGHCYNPWLNFKGGRGLATAAGGSLLLVPMLVGVWGVLWVIFYIMRKDILFANIVATVMSILVVFNSGNIAAKYSFPKPVDESSLILLSTSVLILIFIKHIEPLKELVQKQLKKKNDK